MWTLTCETKTAVCVISLRLETPGGGLFEATRDFSRNLTWSWAGLASVVEGLLQKRLKLEAWDQLVQDAVLDTWAIFELDEVGYFELQRWEATTPRTRREDLEGMVDLARERGAGCVWLFRAKVMPGTPTEAVADLWSQQMATGRRPSPMDVVMVRPLV